MKLNKQFLFKLALLMMLSLKASFAIYQNILQLSNTEEISCLLDTDQSEKEEKKELDEPEKIYQHLNTSSPLSSIIDQKQNLDILSNYQILHLEYTTPPPELG